jgi:hypothetical protein
LADVHTVPVNPSILAGATGEPISDLLADLSNMIDDNVWREIASLKREVAALRKEFEASRPHKVVAIGKRRGQMSELDATAYSSADPTN